MSIKSQSQQRFSNDRFRKGYDAIRWYAERGNDEDGDVVKPVRYGGRPLYAGVNVVGVVTQGVK